MVEYRQMTVRNSPPPGNGGRAVFAQKGADLNNATLALNIWIYQRQRNAAIGIAGDTQLLRGLAQFIKETHSKEALGAMATISEAAYLKASIEEYQALALRLTKHVMANLDDDDTRDQGVHIVKAIDAHVTRLAEQLETLWQMT